MLLIVRWKIILLSMFVVVAATAARAAESHRTDPNAKAGATATVVEDVVPPSFRAPRHGTYVVAHRGAHNGIPENSLPAYQKAIDLGADFVEIDVRTTKDGKFVSVHNSTIDAYVPGASGKVEDFTLQELRALDIGVRMGPAWKGARIPTLEEILDLCKGKIGIYLDLKQAPIGPLVQMIQDRGMERDVIWFAADTELMELKRLCRRCIPMPQPNSAADLPALLARFQPRVVASNCDEISENFLRTCHEGGAIVIADETTPDGWQQVLDWGLDGIQTDHPAELIEFLKKRSSVAHGDRRR